MSTTTTHHRARRRSRPDVRNAWLSMLLLPVAFLAGFAGGEGLMSLLGHAGDGRVPAATAALVAIPIVIVVAVPAAVSSWFAVRAARRGDTRGWLPAGILVLVAVIFAAQNLLAYLYSW